MADYFHHSRYKGKSPCHWFPYKNSIPYANFFLAPILFDNTSPYTPSPWILTTRSAIHKALLASLPLTALRFVILLSGVVSVLQFMLSSGANLPPIDLVDAVKRDPRYLPLLPKLFDASDLGTTPRHANPAVPMLYDLLELGSMYPPELQRC